MAKPLVIVESPAKAKTLARFLGRDYRVEASFGHVRDLPESGEEVPESIRKQPWGRLGVDVTSDFTPYYVIPRDKKKYVAALRSALRDASEVLLATDPDREGESISWHLREVLRPKVPTRRIVFHEITEGAVREALAKARDNVDEDLVKAQEGRRILDRLFGYTLSPVLWKKVQRGLSAGRVQSVAVRLLVEREEARRAFRSANYWDLKALLAGDGREFTAKLVRVGGAKVADSGDFDAQGQLTAKGARALDEAAARALAAGLERGLPWRVTRVEARPGTERPAPPFTTSTLTQEASRKLGFSTKRTMDIAQRLFQGVELRNGEIEGLITYHRTDSTTLSDKALNEAARVIRNLFGDEYYQGPRRYQTKVKNAQEAHEAIRPTDFRQRPQDLEGVLDPDELKLYDLIWKRTMASQMPDARVTRTTIEIEGTTPDGETATFTATGKTIDFAGFRRAYVEGSDDPQSELEDQESLLPRCAVGDRVGRGEAIEFRGLEPQGHDTMPPPRYTEAALIKELERAGIGRPSTYAAIIETIVHRGYVFRQRNQLVPTFTAFAVTQLLRQHFSDYVDVGFTAEMEEDLDEISNGARDQRAFLRQFYVEGDGRRPGLERRVSAEEPQIDYPAIDIGVDPTSGQPIRVRIGRNGPFLQRGEAGSGQTASIPDDLPPADLTLERAVALLDAKAAGPRVLGTDPTTGQPVYVMQGRFGPYVQLGETPEAPAKKGARAPKPPRASLPAGQTPDTITLDLALKLLSLPRTIGLHPDDGQPVLANFGRFGPYVKHGDEFRSLESEDDVFTITLEQAVELLRQPKRSRRRAAASRTVIADLGPHPETGKPIRVLSGRYGPYVTDGAVNATLPKGSDPAKVTREEALELLRARAEAGPAKRGARKRASSGGRGRKLVSA